MAREGERERERESGNKKKYVWSWRRGKMYLYFMGERGKLEIACTQSICCWK
jgi:hypothetical protein